MNADIDRREVVSADLHIRPSLDNDVGDPSDEVDRDVRLLGLDALHDPPFDGRRRDGALSALVNELLDLDTDIAAVRAGIAEQADLKSLAFVPGHAQPYVRREDRDLVHGIRHLDDPLVGGQDRDGERLVGPEERRIFRLCHRALKGGHELRVGRRRLVPEPVQSLTLQDQPVDQCLRDPRPCGAAAGRGGDRGPHGAIQLLQSRILLADDPQIEVALAASVQGRRRPPPNPHLVDEPIEGIVALARSRRPVADHEVMAVDDEFPGGLDAVRRRLNLAVDAVDGHDHMSVLERQEEMVPSICFDHRLPRRIDDPLPVPCLRFELQFPVPDVQVVVDRLGRHLPRPLPQNRLERLDVKGLDDAFNGEIVPQRQGLPMSDHNAPLAAVEQPCGPIQSGLQEVLPGPYVLRHENAVAPPPFHLRSHRSSRPWRRISRARPYRRRRRMPGRPQGARRAGGRERCACFS